MGKNKSGKVRKVFGVIFKVLGIILALIVLAVAVSAIRHYFMCKSDRTAFENAYGEFYTTKSGDKMNYTFYDSDSDKVAVVLPAYGTISTHYEFDTFAKELEDDYKFVLVEPLGIGLSDEATTPRTVENYCDELHGLMEYLGYDKYTLICHSISGAYALQYVNQYPSEIEAFIGIDASVPKQTEMDIAEAKPETMVSMYNFMNIALGKTGLYRIMTETSADSLWAGITTLSETDKKLYTAMACTIAMNDTQMNEIRLMGDNFKRCRDLKFPESIPVLYVLSKSNTEMMAEWKPLHEELVTNPESKVVVIEGYHYLHQTSLDALLKEIRDWTKAN